MNSIVNMILPFVKLELVPNLRINIFMPYILDYSGTSFEMVNFPIPF